MDDIVARYKYPRHSTYYRRKRRATKAAYSTAEKIAKQVALSALILLLVVIIKSIDTPVTNFITSKINNILSADIEFQKVFDSVGNFFKKLNEDPEKLEDDAIKEAVLGSGYQEQYSADNEVSEIVEKDIETIISDIKKQYSFAAPLEGILSSSYGERIDPFTRQLKHHYGVDIDAGQGSNIKAALDGFVVEARSKKEYGDYIKIDHGNGLYTIYAHCSEFMVNEGQEVKQGQVIAKVGDRGLDIGSHLHFEIWKDGEPLDPLCFIDFPLE
ncbi:MAG TPA: M23 family metallopeptidase [Clostridiaceae bacterium]|nr:M23 family metallopeptidase [Clostridiaceae bacterium]